MVNNAIRARSILVIDLELNQPSEKIIELGFVIGDPTSQKILVKESYIVNPLEPLSDEIIELTGIDQDMANKGISLPNAFNAMAEQVLKQDALPIIHQWGVGDTPLLRKQIPEKMEWIYGRRFIDVKALSQAHSIINGINCYGGLRKMASRFGIQIDKAKQHRASYDAEITFMLHCKLSQLLLSKKA